jgi:hypothetical protein
LTELDSYARLQQRQPAQEEAKVPPRRRRRRRRAPAREEAKQPAREPGIPPPPVPRAQREDIPVEEGAEDLQSEEGAMEVSDEDEDEAPYAHHPIQNQRWSDPEHRLWEIIEGGPVTRRDRTTGYSVRAK